MGKGTASAAKPLVWPYFLVIALILLGGVVALAVLLGRTNAGGGDSSTGEVNAEELEELVRDEEQAFYTQADVASTQAIDLQTLNIGDTVDDVEVLSTTRVLLKNQTDGTNGVYTFDVTTSGWERVPELKNADKVLPGTLVFVSQGATNGNHLFYVTFVGESLNTRDADGNPKREFADMRVSDLAPNATAFKELTTNGDNRIELKAPHALDQNLTFTLPDNYGAVHQFLQARSADGALGWQHGAVVHVDTRAPATGDSAFPPGSLWVNHTDNSMHYLADNTSDASVWLKLVVTAGAGTFEYYLESIVQDQGGTAEREFSRLGSILFRGDVVSQKSATVAMIRSNLFVENASGPVMGEVKILDLNSRLTLATLSTSSTNPEHVVATSGVSNVPSTSAVLEFSGRVVSGTGVLRMMNVQFEIKD